MTNPPQAVEANRALARKSQSVRFRALANRNFRLLWLGEGLSLFGDQFYLIALPWLVFEMTGSSVAFGSILMVAGIPRAVFILIGGVMTDRFSPRSVMIVSNLLRLAITLLLVLLLAGQALQLWMLFVIAFSFGLVDAFFHPAYRAMLPLIVRDDDLQASNSLMLGTSQLAQIIGPGVAGVLVRSVGLLLSFVFDALTFLLTSFALALMRPPARPRQAEGDGARKRSIGAEIGEMLAFVRRDPLLKTVIPVIVAVNFLFTGPLIVGTATLSRTRFVEGSAAYGGILSAFGFGALIGMLAAGVFRPQRPGLVSLLLVALEGLVMVGVAYTSGLMIVCTLFVVIGFGAGFGNVTVITLTQKHVTKDMLGRVMSLIVLAEVGLTPISNALSGVLAEWNVTALFVAAGILLAAAALLATTNPQVRAVEN